MKKFKYKNWLSEQIAKVYIERFEDDESYLSEKLERISEQESKYEAMQFIATNLDEIGIEMLSEKLGIKNSDDLKSLQKIWAYL